MHSMMDSSNACRSDADLALAKRRMADIFNTCMSDLALAKRPMDLANHHMIDTSNICTSDVDLTKCSMYRKLECSDFQKQMKHTFMGKLISDIKALPDRWAEGMSAAKILLSLKKSKVVVEKYDEVVQKQPERIFNNEDKRLFHQAFRRVQDDIKSMVDEYKMTENKEKPYTYWCQKLLSILENDNGKCMVMFSAHYVHLHRRAIMVSEGMILICR